MIDLFYTAPKVVEMIAARLKGVLHNRGASIFEDNGFYLFVLTPLKGRD